MRLLLITPLYPPAVGGAATYFADIVPQLKQHDQIEKIFLLTEQMAGQPKHTSDGKVELLRLLPTRVSQQRPYFYHALTYIQTQIWFATQLKSFIKKNEIDLVQYHTRFRGKLFYKTIGNLPCPVIADFRDKLSEPMDLKNASDYLLCCSQGIFDFAQQGGYPVAKMKYIPATFNRPTLPTNKQLQSILDKYKLTDKRYILYLGDMNWKKGVYELIDAFQTWHENHSEAYLIMAGTNRDGDKFLAALKQHPAIHYLGHIPREEVPALITGAELLVLPSRSEGLPTVILEAIALGKKVICPPDIAEFSQHLPQYVLPKIETDTIIKKIDLVWQDNNIPAYPLQQHNPQQVVRQLVNFYSQL